MGVILSNRRNSGTQIVSSHNSCNTDIHQRKSGWTGNMGFVRLAWIILHPTQWHGIQQTSSTVVHLYNVGRNLAPHGRSKSVNDVNSHRYTWLIKSYPAEDQKFSICSIQPPLIAGCLHSLFQIMLLWFIWQHCSECLMLSKYWLGRCRQCVYASFRGYANGTWTT